MRKRGCHQPGSGRIEDEQLATRSFSCSYRTTSVTGVAAQDASIVFRPARSATPVTKGFGEKQRYSSRDSADQETFSSVVRTRDYAA